MTDAEFEQLRQTHPDVARYFEQTEDGQDVEPISSLKVPEVDESAPIYDQWEQAAKRLLTSLTRSKKAFIFSKPVDPEELNIPDYFTVVKRPMDFSTIKTKLKENKYANMQEFLDDIEQVFTNCRLYNGTESDVGQIGLQIQDEYQKLASELAVDFYKV